MAAKRKVVFVIVEGPTDDDALGTILNRIYNDNLVFVHIVHGDITTRKGVNSSNILSQLGDMVKYGMRINRWQKNNIQEIIHIVDMDGAYVSDEFVTYDSAAVKPIYSTEEIRTCNADGIKKRNEIKRENLDKISSTSTLCGIPYQVYYLSCNLDHALYGKLNSSDAEKEDDAHKFSKKYKDDIVGFIDFISESDFSKCGDYLESWRFIKESKHSLERYTNLGICIKRAIAGNLPKLV